ncbi:hypothetical protein RHS01_06674 [Rhizoctonia solani]|uniref:Uncharacterized protein n=1 Tax=Rhizoctonia solani TaxID=456999 RepID=A0A8H7M3Q7_9AGAM|nr:hypothetical protein RHS01_06674 [Rhizoctonia solani]
MNQDRVERKNVGQSVRFVRVAVSESGTPLQRSLSVSPFGLTESIPGHGDSKPVGLSRSVQCNIAVAAWSMAPFERGLWTRLKGYFKTRERLLLGYTWGCQFDYKRSSPTFKFAELSEDMLSPSSWSESNVQRLSPHNVPGSSVRFTGLPPKEETNLTQEET